MQPPIQAQFFNKTEPETAKKDKKVPKAKAKGKGREPEEADGISPMVDYIAYLQHVHNLASTEHLQVYDELYN